MEAVTRVELQAVVTEDDSKAGAAEDTTTTAGVVEAVMPEVAATTTTTTTAAIRATTSFMEAIVGAIVVESRRLKTSKLRLQVNLTHSIKNTEQVGD